MWTSDAGAGEIAIRATYVNLRQSLPLDEGLPLTFGQVDYVDLGHRPVPRFGSGALFHKRFEYRSEGEGRALLPGAPLRGWGPTLRPKGLDFSLDTDVTEQRGRYVSVDPATLVQGIILSPLAPSWFTQVVGSAIKKSPTSLGVTRSAIDQPPNEPGGRNSG